MAPFDDTTLATSNLSKDKNKTGNRRLTVDTSHGKSDMKQRNEKLPAPHPPAYYPPHQGEYRHNIGSYHEDDVNRPHDQHFHFYDNDPIMDYGYEYGREYEYEYSTTPIAINTPQRSNKSFRVEGRKGDEAGEGEQHPHPNSSDVFREDRYDANCKSVHNVAGYYNQPLYYAHPNDYPTHEFDYELRGRTPSKTKTVDENKITRSTTAPTKPPKEDSRFTFHHLPHYHSGWFSPYDCPQHAHPPQEPYDRHYFSPSPPPPPPPPSPYSDYYIPSSDTFMPRADSSPLSWYEGGRGSYDEHDATRKAPVPFYAPYPTANQSEHYHPDPHPPAQEKQRPGTPSSNQSVKRIRKVTPGRAAGRKPPSASTIDMKSNHFSSSSNAIVTPGDKSGTTADGASTFVPSSPFVTLRDSDIVCGRGAPTNFHVGNSRFRSLVLDYHRSYFVAKRSDKPRIAMKVLDVLASRGARFVRRVKGRSSGSSYWQEVAHKIAYEKVCQALRDAGGTPRQMLSLAAASALNAKTGGNESSVVGKKGVNGGEEGKENDANNRC